MLNGYRLATVQLGLVALRMARFLRLIFWSKDSASPWVKENTTSDAVGGVTGKLAVGVRGCGVAGASGGSRENSARL